MAKKTHHKHSSSKGYRKLLETIAAIEGVHRVVTGKVKPRMGAGRPIAPISKVRRIESGLAITMNVDGAIVDGYIVTDRAESVADSLRALGLTA